MNRQPLLLRLATQYGVRGTIGVAAVTSSIALGQAVLHERQYRPLPQLQAPLLGRELPEALALRLREKREEWRQKLMARTEVVKEEVTAKSLKLKKWREHLNERYQEKIRRFLNFKRRDTVDDMILEKPKYRVLFLGDSLVTGIGGAAADASEGPPLPRRVCRALAQRLGVQIEWHALGLTGGDLDDISRNLLPKLRALFDKSGQDSSKRTKLEEDEHSQGHDNFDIVVLMCGLNDFKYLARGHLRTPWAFKQRLSTLLDDIRSEVGDDCRIVLPALPVSLASFQEPLKSYVCILANIWDQQKQRLAAASRLTGNIVDFIDVLRVDATANNGRILVADDGVHPNEHGYELWSQHIARDIANNIMDSDSESGPPLADHTNNEDSLCHFDDDEHLLFVTQ